jgi:hypothetical protein
MPRTLSMVVGGLFAVAPVSPKQPEGLPPILCIS